MGVAQAFDLSEECNLDPWGDHSGTCLETLSVGWALGDQWSLLDSHYWAQMRQGLWQGVHRLDVEAQETE